MNKSDLRTIILEELEKSNGSLLNEKFASDIITGINKRISGTREAHDLWTSTANTFGVAWDQVKDEHVSNGVDSGKSMLNIFFVKAGTKNPYDTGNYRSGEFYSDGLLGITVGKKVIGFTGQFLYNDRAATNRNRKVDFSPSNNDMAGDGGNAKVWNYKRMAEVATEVFSIDLDAVKDWNRELKELREIQRTGAVFMKSNKAILKDNKNRYEEAISAIRDAEVDGKELDIIMSHIEEAEKNLAVELDRKAKDLRANIVYSGWDNPFKLAVNTYEEMIKQLEDFRYYTKAASDFETSAKYYSQRLTDAAKEVKELKANFDKKLKKALSLTSVKID